MEDLGDGLVVALVDRGHESGDHVHRCCGHVPPRRRAPGAPSHGSIAPGNYHRAYGRRLGGRYRWMNTGTPNLVHVGAINVRRSPLVLQPDSSRVIGRRYVPGEDPTLDGQPRLDRIVQGVMALA